MKRLLLSLTCAAVLCGCGGAGFDIGLGSPFEGIWSGTWTGGVANGPVNFSVDLIGEIRGTMHSDVSGEDSPFNGVILENGDTTVIIEFPSESQVSGTGVLTLSGDPEVLSGTLNFDGDDIVFTLARS